jgi:hypothetical protein
VRFRGRPWSSLLTENSTRGTISPIAHYTQMHTKQKLLLKFSVYFRSRKRDRETERKKQRERKTRAKEKKDVSQKETLYLYEQEPRFVFCSEVKEDLPQRSSKVSINISYILRISRKCYYVGNIAILPWVSFLFFLIIIMKFFLMHQGFLVDFNEIYRFLIFTCTPI